MLISDGCRASRSLANISITIEVPDWAALCARTQTACNAKGVIDNKCECLDCTSAPVATQVCQDLQSGRDKEGQRGRVGGGGWYLCQAVQDTCQAHTQLSCLQD